MGLIKQVHRDPRERNVYLNPKRSDQVLVFIGAVWEVLQVAEATRSLFDRTADGIRKTTSLLEGCEWKKLEEKLLEAVRSIWVVYEDNREEHIARAKGAMTAHLENTAPDKTPPEPPAAKDEARRRTRNEAEQQKEARTAQVFEERSAHMENMTPASQRLALPAPPTKNEASPTPPAAKNEARNQQPQKELSELPVAQKKCPPPFTIDVAIALLRATRRMRGESHASYAKRLFEGARDQDPGRIMTKLWEAQEEGLLSEMETIYVRELVTKHDKGELA